MADGFVKVSTCDALHGAQEKRIDRVEKDTEKQWEVIEEIRKVMQKQAVQIAGIVGGVSAIVQLASFIATYLTEKH